MCIRRPILRNSQVKAEASVLFIVAAVRAPTASDRCLRQMALETDAISWGWAPFGSNHWCSIWPVSLCVRVCMCVRARVCVCEESWVFLAYIGRWFSGPVEPTDCLLQRHSSICVWLHVSVHVCVCARKGQFQFSSKSRELNGQWHFTSLLSDLCIFFSFAVLQPRTSLATLVFSFKVVGHFALLNLCYNFALYWLFA